MPFPNPATMFQPGGPGGPGRPRKRPRRVRGTPWRDIRQPGADIPALADQWVAMIRQGHHAALREMIGLVEARPDADPELEARIRSAVRDRLARRSVRPVPPVAVPTGPI